MQRSVRSSPSGSCYSNRDWGGQWCQGVLRGGSKIRWHDVHIDIDLKWMLTASFRSFTKGKSPHPDTVSEELWKGDFPLFFHSHHMLSQSPSLTCHSQLSAVLACPVTSAGDWYGFLYGCPIHCLGIFLLKKGAAWGVSHKGKWEFLLRCCCGRQSEAQNKWIGGFSTLPPSLKRFHLESRLIKAKGGDVFTLNQLSPSTLPYVLAVRSSKSEHHMSCVLSSLVTSVFGSQSLFQDKVLHGHVPISFQVFGCIFLSPQSDFLDKSL